jgi:hypothetical protein
MRLLVCGLAVALLAVAAHATNGDSSTVTKTAIQVENAVFASGSHQFSWALTDFTEVPDEGHGFADRRLQRFMTNVVDELAQEPQAFVAD